ncbi:hypothetical protein [Paracoccus marcusii]|uniref:hypothetical protein n=1 Tax=Paracoccus marcusii TaxID=59779 RepID=UPI00249156D4|nr:hypothetical protein [Paracoccus marcusii]
MKVVGLGSVKKMSALVPGELVSLQARGKPCLAVCISNDGPLAELVLLSGLEQSVGWKVRPESHRECYSYGLDWILDFSSSEHFYPDQMRNGEPPQFILDEDGLKLSFMIDDYRGVGFWDVYKKEMIDRWPMSAVILQEYSIWQSEAAMDRPDAKPLFVKEAPAASDQGLTP